MTKEFNIYSFCGFRGHERARCWRLKRVLKSNRRTHHYINEDAQEGVDLPTIDPKENWNNRKNNHSTVVPKMKRNQGMKKKVEIEPTKAPQESSNGFKKVWVRQEDLDTLEIIKNHSASFKPRSLLVHDCSTNE